MVNLNRLAPFNGDNNNGMQSFGRMKITEGKLSQVFVGACGTTSEEHRNLFTVPREFSLTHCVAANLDFRKGFRQIA